MAGANSATFAWARRRWRVTGTPTPAFTAPTCIGCCSRPCSCKRPQRFASGPLARGLHALIDACPGWTLWALHDRPEVRGPCELARGPVALLGDAAHPMRPYLSQGAGMALEDAWTLGLLAERYRANPDWAALFARYAAHRWARNARVQRTSLNNGRAYHARGPLRWGRNVAMTLLGERLLANHWLYSGPPRPPLLP